MNSIIYFGYFLKTTNYSELLNYIKKVNTVKRISYFHMIIDMLISSFKYKASFEDYFVFRFYEKTRKERYKYVTTGKIYEFHNKMNSKQDREIFRKKNIFNKVFKQFIKRDYLYINGNNYHDFERWVSSKKQFIAKPNEGVIGKGIRKIDVTSYSSYKDIFDYLINNNLHLVEEIIMQHKKMNELNPTSVNTIRVITILKDENVHIIGALLRMSKGNIVDNLASGGIAAPIDLDTGKVFRPAVSKDCFVREYYEHPITGHRIKDFEIPYWKDIISMVEKAAKVVRGIKTVGWDIAVTEYGPELIEGNDNWCKTLWQIPYQEGKSHLLEKIELEE